MMIQPAPQTIQPYPIYLDVAPEVIADDEHMLRSPREVLTGAWSEYLRRVLPPLHPEDEAAA